MKYSKQFIPVIAVFLFLSSAAAIFTQAGVASARTWTANSNTHAPVESEGTEVALTEPRQDRRDATPSDTQEEDPSKHNLQGSKGASQKCGGVNTSIIGCDGGDGKDGEVEDTGIWSLLVMAIQIMSAGVGVLALAGIVYGAVLYTSAGGNPEQVKKAKAMFTNVAIGVIAFAGMFTILNFIIPGGVL